MLYDARLGVVPGPRDADRARLRSRTAELVEERWAEIDRVAQELLLAGRLDCVVVDRILLAVRGEITEQHLAMLRAFYRPQFE